MHVALWWDIGGPEHCQQLVMLYGSAIPIASLAACSGGLATQSREGVQSQHAAALGHPHATHPGVTAGAAVSVPSLGLFPGCTNLYGEGVTQGVTSM